MSSARRFSNLDSTIPVKETTAFTVSTSMRVKFDSLSATSRALTDAVQFGSESGANPDCARSTLVESFWIVSLTKLLSVRSNRSANGSVVSSAGLM